jgi:two-component system phosphate regulon sensor histidine kinase PhoR
MNGALHWRGALWNLLLVPAVFLVLGPGMAAVLLSVLVLITTLLIAWRLRVRVSRPLGELTRALREAGRSPVPAIPRGAGEVRDLTSTVIGWRGEAEARMRDLSDSRVRLESVLRAMDEGVLVFDRASRITLANAALLGLLDLGRDPVGKTCLEVFRNASLDQALAAAFRGEAVDAVEFPTRSNRVLRALVSPMGGPGGRPGDAAVMVLEDLTDIRRVDRIRRDFVANVSHEFKTPLTSILGYAETIQAEASDASHREFADTIARNARYLESLVNDLLVLARIEGEPPSELEDLDLLDLVGEQVGLRRKLAAAQSRTIEVDCPPIPMRADRGRLSIALSNLIDNAIRYNRPSGSIRVVCRTDGGEVVLEVSDQGFGIPADELPRIFERFYRVDRARTRNAGGTGLGLAIARHAVESQGGALTVTSQAGAGSTFRIRLPRRLDEGPPDA